MLKQQSSGLPEPKPSRPHIPEYGIPESEEGMLPWSHVCERMENALNYWIATISPGGQPHATPVWGVWLDDAPYEGFYFDGSPQTRRGRNLAANPAVAIHLESGDDVVILKGEAHQIDGRDRAFSTRLAAAYAAKYKLKDYAPTPDTWDNGGLYVVRPHVAFAWTHFPKDATRWLFGRE
ncbi:MAG: pyridoxamine 5'-phosphate oxidase family protein [Anaerolineae bacterium]|nr:pyridoxamine 5'-phosphate oxidase family protein [Anaerolineae bacterium]